MYVSRLPARGREGVNRGSKGGCIHHRDKQGSQNPRKAYPPPRSIEEKGKGETWGGTLGTEQKGRGRDEGTRKPGAETRRRGELGQRAEWPRCPSLPARPGSAGAPPPPAQGCLGSLKAAAVNMWAQAEPDLNPNYTFSWWANL